MTQSIKHIIPANLRWTLLKLYLRMQGWWYRGDRYECTGCQGSFRTFLPMKEGANPRPNVVCPRCGILERHRLLMLYLKNKTNLFTAQHKVLYFAPEYSLQEHLQRQENIDYLSTDISSPLAMQEFDIMDIPHPDGAFTAIFCSHVLAHVQDDRKALEELYRITKKGGFLIIMDRPFELEKTIEDKDADTPEKRFALFNQDDRYRMYGKDFVQRLEEPGYKVEVIDYANALTVAEREKYRISDKDLIYCCWK